MHYFANFWSTVKGLTLDVIGQCGMAMKVNCQLDPFDKLLTMVKKTLKRQVWRRILFCFFKIFHPFIYLSTLSLFYFPFLLFQIDVTAIIGSFFPELEELIAWMYKGGRKKTNDVIISWCDDILQKRRHMGYVSGEK